MYKPSWWLIPSPHSLPHTAVSSMYALVLSLYSALKMRATWFHTTKKPNSTVLYQQIIPHIGMNSPTERLNVGPVTNFPCFFYTRKRYEIILAFPLWILSLDYIRAASPFIFPCPLPTPPPRCSDLFQAGVCCFGELLALCYHQWDRRTNGPPQSICAKVCFRSMFSFDWEGWEEVLLSLFASLLLWSHQTSSLPGFVCLSNMRTSRENMMKQVFKAIKGQAGAQTELSIITWSTWRGERTVWVLGTYPSGIEEGLSGDLFFLTKSAMK